MENLEMKGILMDFARFIFRSGEVSYRDKKSWEFSKNIDEYILDTWSKFPQATKEREKWKK